MALSPSSSPSIGGAPSAPRARQFSWMLLGALGGAMLSAAVFTWAGQLQAALVDNARQKAAISTPPARAFGATLADSRMAAKRLPGVNGEMFAPAVALDETPAAPRGEISLAAWDRLSSGDCMTLTTKSGQMLSFRIVGAKKADGADDTATHPEIDLAVTACEGAGEPIAKAVIEPSQQPAKDAVAQRTL